MLTLKLSRNFSSGSIGAYLGIRVLVHIPWWCPWICWEQCLAGHRCDSRRIRNNHCHFMLWKCATYVAAQLYRTVDLHYCRRLCCRNQHVACATRSGKFYLLFFQTIFLLFIDGNNFIVKCGCEFTGTASRRTDCNSCHWPHHFCRTNEMGLHHDGWHIVRVPNTARCHQHDSFVHKFR